jgi:hypothetical protein
MNLFDITKLSENHIQFYEKMILEKLKPIEDNDILTISDICVFDANAVFKEMNSDSVSCGSGCLIDECGMGMHTLAIYKSLDSKLYIVMTSGNYVSIHIPTNIYWLQ